MYVCIWSSYGQEIWMDVHSFIGITGGSYIIWKLSMCSEGKILENTIAHPLQFLITLLWHKKENFLAADDNAFLIWFDRNDGDSAMTLYGETNKFAVNLGAFNSAHRHCFLWKNQGQLKVSYPSVIIW